MNPFSPSKAIINSQEMGESLEGKSACLGFHGRFFIESHCSLSCPGFFFFFFYKDCGSGHEWRWSHPFSWLEYRHQRLNLRGKFQTVSDLLQSWRCRSGGPPLWFQSLLDALSSSDVQIFMSPRWIQMFPAVRGDPSFFSSSRSWNVGYFNRLPWNLDQTFSSLSEWIALTLLNRCYSSIAMRSLHVLCRSPTSSHNPKTCTKLV